MGEAGFRGAVITWNTVGREIKKSVQNVNITQNLHLTASFDQLSPIIPWSNGKITPL